MVDADSVLQADVIAAVHQLQSAIGELDQVRAGYSLMDIRRQRSIG